MLYLKQISYFSKVVYQVICLATLSAVFIKIYQDQQGYIICLRSVQTPLMMLQNSSEGL